MGTLAIKERCVVFCIEHIFEKKKLENSKIFYVHYYELGKNGYINLDIHYRSIYMGCNKEVLINFDCTNFNHYNDCNLIQNLL